MKAVHWIPLLAVLSLVACSENKPAAPAAGEPGPHAEDASSDHGDTTDLGTLTVAGKEFSVVRLGALVPGKEGAFEVRPQGVSADEIALLNLYLWVEDQDGNQVSAAAKGTREGSTFHFHLTPRDSGSGPARVVLRLRGDGTDERASLPLDGDGHDHDHEHVDGPHGGVPATFAGGGASGHLELKLHDDQGDLELWLYHDDRLTKPFDLPITASVEIELVDVDGRKITLRPRDDEKNPDEDGKPNIRDGRTNYFIYPSRDGEDAAWLRGKEFQSIVIVRFAREGTAFASEEFVARPHAH